MEVGINIYGQMEVLHFHVSALNTVEERDSQARVLHAGQKER